MGRTGQQRLDAILPAIAARDEFKVRVDQAEGDAVKCADLMAEGIAMLREANGLETVGISGAEIVKVMRDLIAERDALKADLASETAWAKQYSDRALTFQAENNDLREALEKITRAGGRSTPLSDKIQNIARAALKK